MGLSLGHLLIVLVVVLLFGARRLPELGTALGKGMRAFRKGLEGKSDSSAEIPPGTPKEPVTHEPKTNR